VVTVWLWGEGGGCGRARAAQGSTVADPEDVPILSAPPPPRQAAVSTDAAGSGGKCAPKGGGKASKRGKPLITELWWWDGGASWGGACNDVPAFQRVTVAHSLRGASRTAPSRSTRRKSNERSARTKCVRASTTCPPQ
jgi:hypothetical protein